MRLERRSLLVGSKLSREGEVVVTTVYMIDEASARLGEAGLTMLHTHTYTGLFPQSIYLRLFFFLVF